MRNMKSEHLYHELKAAAEKLGVTVAEKSFRNVGIPVESGLCTVKGRRMYIVDRNKTLSEKVQLLAGCLAGLPTEQIFMVPYVREYIEKMKPQS